MENGVGKREGGGKELGLERVVGWGRWGVVRKMGPSLVGTTSSFTIIELTTIAPAVDTR